MKKILLIPSGYPTEKNTVIGSFFEEQALFLYSKGIDIRILYLKDEKKSFLKSLVQRIANKQLYFSTAKQEPIALIGHLAVNKKSGYKALVRKLYSGYVKGYKKITSDGWIPDIIHAQSTENAGVIAHQLSKKTGIPYYIIEHNPIVFSRSGRLQKKAFENATKTAAVSYHLMRHLLIQTSDAYPTVIWNLVNEHNFVINRNKKNTAFRIVTISYPDRIKDMDTFFKAIEQLSLLDQDPIEIIVIGNDDFGDLKNASTQKIESIAAQYNVSKKCTFIPYLERKEMAELLPTADLFISTSISETFGIAIREAMMCGIPVISTKNGGADDTITSENGVLVNLRDYKSIAENIVAIKNAALRFDPQTIRESVIRQSGTEVFYSKMKEFYDC